MQKVKVYTPRGVNKWILVACVLLDFLDFQNCRTAKSRTPLNRVKPGFWVLYGRLGRFDAWKMFVWTFENFIKSRSGKNFKNLSDLGFLDLFLDVWTCVLGLWT